MLGALKTAVLGTPGPPKQNVHYGAEPLQNAAAPPPPPQLDLKPKVSEEKREEKKSYSGNSYGLQYERPSRLEDSEDAPPTIPRRSATLARRFQQSPSSDDIKITGSSTPPRRNAVDQNKPENISPTKKGILMTPGTILARKKSVAFHPTTPMLDHHKPRPQPRASSSGLPNDCPGKFPSPYTPRTVKDDEWEDVGTLGVEANLFENKGVSKVKQQEKSASKFDSILKASEENNDEQITKKNPFGLKKDFARNIKPIRSQSDSATTLNTFEQKSQEPINDIDELRKKAALYDKLLPQVERMQKANSAALDAIEQAEFETEKRERELQDAEARIEMYEKELQKLKSALRDRDNKMDELSVLFEQGGIHGSLDQGAELRKVRMELRTAKRELEALEALKKENDELKRKVKELDLKLERTTREKDLAEKEIASLLERPANNSTDKHLRDENERLMAENHRLRMDGFEKEKKLRDAERTVISLKDQALEASRQPHEETPTAQKVFSLDDDPFLAQLRSSTPPKRDELNPSKPTLSAKDADQTASPKRRHSLFGSPRKSNIDIFAPSAANPFISTSPKRTGKSAFDTNTLDTLDLNALNTSTPSKSKPKFSASGIENIPYYIESPKNSVIPVAPEPGKVGSQFASRRASAGATRPGSRGKTTVAASAGRKVTGSGGDRLAEAKRRLEEKRKKRRSAL